MRRGLSTSRIPIAVAVYLPEQYARLLATAEDASDLEPTWQEWHTVYQETRQNMAALGEPALSMPPTCCLNGIHDKSSLNRGFH